MGGPGQRIEGSVVTGPTSRRSSHRGANRSAGPSQNAALGRRPGWICVARVGAAHGVRGEVRVHPFTTDPLAVTHYGALESEDGTVALQIVGARPAKGFLVVRFAGVEDRTAATRLRNLSLFVPRERLPAPEDADTYYHVDLVGLAVHRCDGTPIGMVVGLHNFGGGDLLEVAPQSGGATVLLPFTKAVVPIVDLKAGHLVVDPPEGAFGNPGGAPGARPPRGSTDPT